MAREPRTRQPKKKFQDRNKVLCFICGAEKILCTTKSGAFWQCPENINH